MWLIREKLARRIPQIGRAAIRATIPLPAVQVRRSAAVMEPLPGDEGWEALEQGAPWGIPGETVWLRTEVSAPESWHNTHVLLHLSWEGRGLESVEAIAYLDGQALAGLDEFHRRVLLPPETHDGHAHSLLIRCFTPQTQPFGGLSLQQRDPAIFELHQLMATLLDVSTQYPESDPTRHTIEARLNQAYHRLDLREGWESDRFAASACEALETLRRDLGSGRPPTDPHPPSSIPYPLSPTLIATGHAHLDVAWLWPLWRTRQKVVHTVATALHLMERYPEYHFSMSQPQVYQYLKEDDPELYARMCARIAEGRFEPVGIMWLEADCNLPSGESLARQLLHGTAFWAAEFRVESRVCWMPDVFGYSAALPQLLRLAGVPVFMTTKISWSQFNRMPHDTFRWRGIDGSEVLAHFVTATDKPPRHPADAQFYTYNGEMTPAEVFGTWNHYREKPLNQELLYIYGHGDGGGGPTEEMLEAARMMASLPGFPAVQPGRANDQLLRLYERVWDDPALPRWAGELYLEFHRGTLTSQARAKAANRRSEQRYRSAEWLAAWAWALGGPALQGRLNEGWRLIMLNQFHDVLPGSSIAQVYADADRDYAEVERIAQEVIAEATTYLNRIRGAGDGETGRPDGGAILVSAQTPETGDRETGRPGDQERRDDPGERPDCRRTGEPQIQAGAVPAASGLLVWNSLPWERADALCIDGALWDGPRGGEQTQEATDWDGRTQILVDAPGIEAYSGCSPAGLGHRGQVAAPTAHALGDGPVRLENAFFDLTIDQSGEVARLYDKRYQREVIAPGTTGNQLVIYEDRPLAWDAWDIDLFYEEKPYPVREVAGMRIVEQGPVRVAVEVTKRFLGTTIRQRIGLWRTLPRIDFVSEVDWQERDALLRVLFPLNLNVTSATYEIQFGAVERPTHRNTSWDAARFEVCGHRWADMSEGGYGAALLNDGKYGYSGHLNTLALSLLKGARWPDPQADRGRHRFTYSLLPHGGDWRTGEVVRRAYELNAPPVMTTDDRTPTTDPGILQSNIQSGIPPGLPPLLSCDANHVIVETIKVAEDGNGLIVRLYEAHNQRGPVGLRFGVPVVAVTECDLLERTVAPVDVQDGSVRFDMRPFEIKTLRVTCR
jgi:alpha-mannosidase